MSRVGNRRSAAAGVSRTGLIGATGLLAVMGFVVFQSLSAGATTCEICVEYRGRTQCRTVSAATEEEAVTAGMVNACAFISGGVTDSMACQRTIPTKRECR